MTGEQAVNQNVSFYPTDLAILEAVQKRNGQTLSGAVRFILREWARTSGLQETIHTAALPQQVSKPRQIKPSARARARAGNVKPESIPGVKRGVKAA
jgi:hypothetical protein